MWEGENEDSKISGYRCLGYSTLPHSAQRLLGYNPTIGFLEGLARTLETIKPDLKATSSVNK